MEKVTDAIDELAAKCDGREDIEDLHAAQARILSMLEAMDAEPGEHTGWNAINVKASGSHGTNGKGAIGDSVTVALVRVSLP